MQKKRIDELTPVFSSIRSSEFLAMHDIIIASDNMGFISVIYIRCPIECYWIAILRLLSEISRVFITILQEKRDQDRKKIQILSTYIFWESLIHYSAFSAAKAM